MGCPDLEGRKLCFKDSLGQGCPDEAPGPRLSWRAETPAKAGGRGSTAAGGGALEPGKMTCMSPLAPVQRLPQPQLPRISAPSLPSPFPSPHDALSFHH